MNGGEFTPQSKVRWNGTALATSFVNANQLTASVPEFTDKCNGLGLDQCLESHAGWWHFR